MSVVLILGIVFGVALLLSAAIMIWGAVINKVPVYPDDWPLSDKDDQ
jgi:hypothetical protein